MPSRIKSPGSFLTLLPYLFFLLWVLILFWPGRIALPTEDQHFLMWERFFKSSDSNFFWDMLSFNRNRLVFKGDAILFRPGTHALIALGDIFFREDFLGAGLTSLLFLIACGSACYYWFSHLTRKTFAFFCALVLITPLAAAKMVLWRHISPYLFCPLFLSLGLAAIQKNSFRKAAIFFFLSCCFHEAATLALAFSGLVLCFFSPPYQRKKLVASFLLPTALYCLISALNFIYYQGWHSPFFDSDPTNTTAALPLMINLIYLVGVSFVGCFVPQLVSLETFEYRTAIWRFPDLPFDFCLVVSLLILTALFCLVRKQRKEFLAQWILPLSFSGIVLFSLLFGRVHSRGWEYLHRSPYYFFFTSWSWCALVAMVTRYTNPRKAPATLIASGLIGVTLISGTRLRSYLELQSAKDVRMASLVSNIGNLLKQHPDWCYAGSVDPILHHFDPLIFYRKSCLYKKGRPVILDATTEGKLIFYDSPPEQGLPVDFGDADNEAKIIGTLFPGQWAAKLTEAQAATEATFSNLPRTSFYLIFNYKNPDDFETLFNDGGRLFRVRWKQKKAGPSEWVGLAGWGSQFSLTLREMKGEVWVFENQMVLGKLSHLSSLAGRMGTACLDSTTCPKDLRVGSLPIPLHTLFRSEVYRDPSSPLKLSTLL